MSMEEAQHLYDSASTLSCKMLKAELPLDRLQSVIEVLYPDDMAARWAVFSLTLRMTAGKLDALAAALPCNTGTTGVLMESLADSLRASYFQAIKGKVDTLRREAPSE